MENSRGKKCLLRKQLVSIKILLHFCMVGFFSLSKRALGLSCPEAFVRDKLCRHPFVCFKLSLAAGTFNLALS